MKKRGLPLLVGLAAQVMAAGTSGTAVDLGTFGQTWPIAERDLLQVIEGKLQKLDREGAIALHQRKIQAHLVKRIQRPAPVAGIRKTEKPRTFLYNPSLMVPYDLKDHQGRLIHRAGTTVNPLKFHRLSKPLLFIDGDDEGQMRWVLSEDRQHKALLILVKGAPFVLREKYPHLSVYFDQGGRLVKKLGIQQVPARVTQAGKRLKVEEVKLSAEGSASPQPAGRPS